MIQRTEKLPYMYKRKRPCNSSVEEQKTEGVIRSKFIKALKQSTVYAELLLNKSHSHRVTES